MPISSYEVAALTGGFNQQVMAGMQHSQMISQQMGGYAPNPAFHPVPTQGENFMAMASAYGGTQGMNMLSGRASGFMGGIPAAGMRFGLGNMMYGMGQQQMLNANLRQNYRHMNAYGGRGFTGGEMGNIGDQLRQMSMQRGPGGEFTSMEELSRLASNMGRMGMADTVRGTREFNEQFRKMLDTVKTVATEMGTSLEEAQKMMSSMRGSGIFRNQGQFAGMMRRGALAGNVSTGELSAAAMMGSQISRMVGGRGSAGAEGGMQFMSLIGTARRHGVLSEEDIYDMTGQTGAEGRQTFMRQQMMADAQFLKSGLGRHVVASMAGPGGKLNEEAVQSFLSGGMDVSGTRQHQQWARGNKAEFMRNEGRYRGEILRRFGGMIRAQQAKQWLEGRGHDLTSGMDDRSMLFFQRKFKVGRDEADNLIKMARNLDTLRDKQAQAMDADQISREVEMADRESSPNEMIKRLDEAKMKVQNSLRQFGADFYRTGAREIQKIIDKTSGKLHRRIDMASRLAARKAWDEGTAGDLLAKSELPTLTGEQQKMYEQAFGGGKLNATQQRMLVSGQYRAFEREGFELRGPGQTGDMTADDLRNRLDEVRKIQTAAVTGGDRGATRLGARMKEQLGTQVAISGVEGRGDDFLNNFEDQIRTLAKGSSPAANEAAELLDKLDSVSPEQRASILGSVAKGAGLHRLIRGRMGKGIGRDPFVGLRGADPENAYQELARITTRGRGRGRVDIGRDLGIDQTFEQAGLMFSEGSAGGRIARGARGALSSLTGGISALYNEYRIGGRRDQQIERYGGAGIGIGEDEEGAQTTTEMIEGAIRAPGEMLGDVAARAGGMFGLDEGFVRGAVRGVTQAAGAPVEDAAKWLAGGVRTEEDAAIYRRMGTDEKTKEMLGGVTGKDPQARKNILKGIEKRLRNAQEGAVKMDETERNTLKAIHGLGKYQQYVQSKGDPPETKEEWAELARSAGVDPDNPEEMKEFTSRIEGASTMAYENQRQAREAHQEEFAQRAEEDRENIALALDKPGLDTEEKGITAQQRKDREEAASIGKEFLQGRLDRADIQLRFRRGDIGEERYKTLMADQQRKEQSSLQKRGLKGRELLARDLRARGQYREARGIQRDVTAEKRLGRAARFGGTSRKREAASRFGIGFTKGEQKELGKKGGVQKILGDRYADVLDQSTLKQLGNIIAGKGPEGKKLSVEEQHKQIKELNKKGVFKTIGEADKKRRLETEKRTNPSYEALTDIKTGVTNLAKANITGFNTLATAIRENAANG